MPALLWPLTRNVLILQGDSDRTSATTEPMQALSSDQDELKSRLQLLLLLGLSFGAVALLSGTVTDQPLALPGPRFFGNVALLLGGIVVTFGLTLSVMHVLRRSRRRGDAAEQALMEVRRALATSESIIRAEQQALVFWDHGRGPQIIVHNLNNVAGLPTSHAELLRFGDWLDVRSAADLKSGLDELFLQGRAFSLLLKTSAGSHVEADGRTAGGRAVLRFRDVAGHKRDLMRILDQHRQLSRDIRAGRTLLEALPMPVWLRSADGRLEWVNAAYVAAVEADSRAEVVEHQIELLETQQRAAINRSLSKGEMYSKRDHLVIGGERRPHDLVVLPAGDAIAGAAIDVTALEMVRGQLDRQVATYERTLDKVATAVASFGRDQRLIFFNDAFARLWQLDRDWLSSRPTDGEILDRLRSLSRLPAQANYRDWKAKQLSIYKSAAEREEWWHLPDRRMVRVIAEQRPDGGVTYLYDDATERLALESRYKTMIDVQRETLDSLKEGVAVFGPDGRLKLSNAAFAGIWRLSPPALAEAPHIGEFIRHARVFLDDDRTWSAISRAVTSVRDTRENFEGQMVRADQSVIDYALIPLPDGATLVTFADVTATKRYERALVERNEALMAADRLKNQFIGHVSYELRTPLTNIIGFGEMLASPHTGPLTEKQREYLSDIAGSSRTLLSIIDDILDLATIDAGTIELKREPVNIRETIQAVVQALSDRAQQARLKLEIGLANDVVRIVADQARLRQILYNLLSNAIGFSNANGLVRIHCWREGSKIAFMVEDQGVGIPREELGRVFERFETRTQGSRHRGAGLGLSIVKSLVELHGGEMSLESEPGRGTRVTVRLPEHPDQQKDSKPLAHSA